MLTWTQLIPFKYMFDGAFKFIIYLDKNSSTWKLQVNELVEFIVPSIEAGQELAQLIIDNYWEGTK